MCRSCFNTYSGSFGGGFATPFKIVACCGNGCPNCLFMNPTEPYKEKKEDES